MVLPSQMLVFQSLILTKFWQIVPCLVGLSITSQRLIFWIKMKPKFFSTSPLCQCKSLTLCRHLSSTIALYLEKSSFRITRWSTNSCFQISHLITWSSQNSYQAVRCTQSAMGTRSFGQASIRLIITPSFFNIKGLSKPLSIRPIQNIPSAIR